MFMDHNCEEMALKPQVSLAARFSSKWYVHDGA